MNVLVLLLLAQTQVVQPVEKPRLEPHKWEIFIGAQGGLRPDTMGFGGGTLLGVNRQLFSFLRAELAVGLGAYAQPTDVLTLIRLGARLELPGDHWHPFLSVAFAHQHESGWDHIKTDPLPAVLGLSEHGVNHRSGIETGLGIAYDVRVKRLPIGGRVGVKASVTHLLGAGVPRYVELTTLVGVTF